MKTKSLAIMWFRQDLRLCDNPALHAACESGDPVLPIYILDDVHAGQWAMGAASRWWLHESLASLDKQLDGNLHYFRGKADDVLLALCRRLDIAGVFRNRCYEPWRRERDAALDRQLGSMDIPATTMNASLLHEPESICKADGTPYRVFTPFYRSGYLESATPREPLAATSPEAFGSADDALDLADLSLLPKIPWHESLAEHWTPGEAAAHARLEAFLDEGVRDYREGRDRPDKENVSRLSPHLHFGELSPHQVWHAATARSAVARLEKDVAHFQRELGWREFSYSLLYHWPGLPTENFQEKFDRFPWRSNDSHLEAWQKGETGYPMVDAGMRQLWQTGYMHNRVRMIVGSFLVKNLLLHWRDGEAWFWDTLVDADLANNSASWQWIAGCGADAAPYFRIFNPVTQGRKFDPDGDYVSRYVPQLNALPVKYIHAPWEAPPEVLEQAGVILGDNYPEPVVDLKASRERALAAFGSLK